MLQCPVCLELMEAPIYQCSGGHTICSTCSKKLTSCPQCRVPLNSRAPIRTLALEQMIEQMEFKYPCTNDGCNVKTSGGEKRANHLASCPRRKISCFHRGCQVTMNIPTLAEHVRSIHGGRSYAVNARGKAHVRYTLPPFTNLGTSSWPSMLIGDNLVIFMRCNPKEIICYCRYISTPVVYKISVSAQHSSARSYKGWARPIDYQKSDEETEAQYLSIPAAAVFYLTDDGKEPDVICVIKIY
jgi:hypothetical protein